MLIVKIGGGKDINWDYVCEDIHELTSHGQKVIIVHGASEKRNEIAEKLGIPTKTVTSPSGVSSVLTDRPAIEVFLMSYSGLVNKQIVETLQAHGVNAVGLSGVDGKLWQAKKKPDIMVKENGKTKLVKGNLTGRVETVNHQLLNLLLDNGYVPVISAPAISHENEIVNTDNDWATAVTAGSLKAKEIIYLFEAGGLLKDFSDKKSVISHIDKNSIDDFMNSAEGRMKKKLLGVKKAFELGVEKVYFGDGRIKNPIKSVLAGKGTIIS
jgi:acetylglutamate/LysW-gamma-L-alpha-aminoadipate kinase